MSRSWGLVRAELSERMLGRGQGGLLACAWLLQVCVLCLSPQASSVPTSEHGTARLSQHGPDMVILHPPDGFLVDDPAALMVAFYVSSFCVSRLGDGLEVAAATIAPLPRSALLRLALPPSSADARLACPPSKGCIPPTPPRAACVLPLRVRGRTRAGCAAGAQRGDSLGGAAAGARQRRQRTVSRRNARAGPRRVRAQGVFNVDTYVL